MQAFEILNKVNFFQISSEHFLDCQDLNGFKIIWLTEGTSHVFIDEKKNQIKIGDFVILMPHHQIKIEANNSSKLNVLSFTIDYLQSEAKFFSIDLFKLLIKNSDSKICQVQIDELYEITTLQEIIFRLNSNNLADQQIGIQLINAILLLIIKNNHEYVSTPDKNFTRIHDFFLLIFTHSTKQKRVSFYSESLFISSKRLNQILQAYSGHSASYFIQEHIIMQAKDLLLSSKMNINEIALELGYEDVAYFSRFFKRWIGISPEKFRRFQKF